MTTTTTLLQLNLAVLIDAENTCAAYIPKLMGMIADTYGDSNPGEGAAGLWVRNAADDAGVCGGL